MSAATIHHILLRDLTRLKTEISSYKNEENIWLLKGSISNSPGNLCLHLIGNLQWFVGAQLGNTGYIRKREEEFTRKNVPREELLAGIDNTIQVVGATLFDFPADRMKEDFPIHVFEDINTTEHFLVHLTTHLSYHLGQINYHRRLIEG